MNRRAGFAILLVLSLASFAAAQQPATLKARPPELVKRPDQDWINSKPLKLSELRGQVVVLHFWTFACSNCQHNYPTLKAWQAAFADKGVTIIGVQTIANDRSKMYGRMLPRMI
jgi:thiol-disulfide isomerase/thioredoxin